MPLKNKYDHVTERFPTTDLPVELLGNVLAGSHVRVIVQRLDEDGEVVDGHPFLEREPGSAVMDEDVADYVRWLRGNV